ncbi:MAG: hypothetical protein ACXW5U_24690 [Thermoanaerobaculia bacterium]
MRRILIPAAALLLLSCPMRRIPALPPGPDDPVASLALLDKFADRVQRDALLASWTATTEPDTQAAGARIGVLPLLLLQDDEVDALRRHLGESRDLRCLQAIHSFAVQLQADADPFVADAMTGIAARRRLIPDLGPVFTDEGDLSRREQLWVSQAQAARDLAPLLRRLIAARSQWARRRSQSGYLDIMRKHRGYDPTVADRLEREVREGLESTRMRIRRPWELELIDPLLAMRMAQRFDAEHCLEHASFVLEHLDLPLTALRIDEVRQTSFSSFAFYPIDPPADQRVVVRPGAGIVPYWSAFHELGHAAMSLMGAPTSCRTLRRPVSSAVSESCAKVGERLFYSEEWLRMQAVPPEDIDALQDWERESERMRMRGILADIELERVVYQSPNADWMSAFVAIQRRTAGVDVGRDFPAWALKRDLAFEPLGRVDYLLARCAQAAVYRRLRVLPGGLLGESAREVLRDDVFRGASAMRYEEWFRRAAGTEPDCSAWLQDVAN